MIRWITATGAALAVAVPLWACSICGPGTLNSQTLRQDAGQSKLVLYGTLTNPRLVGDPATGGGSTDLNVEKVIKNDPFLGNKKTVEIPRYVPVDPKNPTRFLIFCDVLKDKDGKDRLDPYRGVPVKSADVVAYLQGALALDPKDRDKSLLFYFDYLEHRDSIVAGDAFLELAKASDQELGQVAKKFSAEKLRDYIQNKDTPVNRLGLYSFLLGLCGGDRDAALLHSMLQNPSERELAALDGLMSGYILLRPREGWDQLRTALKDEKKPFTQRFAVLRAVRFFQGYQPKEQHREIVDSLGLVVVQGDIADLAIEDLRRWKVWDLSNEVLAQYGKKSHDVPIVRRSIIRYALCCPRPEAARFLADRRAKEADLVKEVEESLQFEKPN